MTKFEIEIGVEMPKPHSCRAKLYPFADMEIGDSFFVPSKEPNKTQISISSRASRHKPKKFATRKVEGGVRVWRVK